MSVDRLLRVAGPLAGVVLVAAVIGFGLALPGYSQGRHPVALLGAQGIPHATAFCWTGFVLPGLLAVVTAVDLQRRLPRGEWSTRIGLQLVLLSGLAFVGMGLLPLDPTDLDNRASQYHASAWLLWGVAFIPGAAMLAASLWRQPGLRPLALVSAVAGLIVLLMCFTPGGIPPAFAQRLAFLAWAAWLGYAGLTAPPPAPRAIRPD